MDQVNSVEISYLVFEPSFGSVYATWRLFCKAISLKLTQKGVILLPFSMLVCQVDPWAGALASVVGPDLWLAPVLPPHTPWQEFIWYTSSSTPGVCAGLLWASQPGKSWHTCSWLFCGSRLTFGLVSGLIWFDRTYILLLLNYPISHDKSSLWEYPGLLFNLYSLTYVLALWLFLEGSMESDRPGEARARVLSQQVSTLLTLLTRV